MGVILWSILSLIVFGCCLQALVCRALCLRVLRMLLSRVSSFKEYSVIIEESGEKQSCFVRTWEDNSLLDICANVEVLGQRVPASESSRAVCSVESSRMSLSIRGGPQAFM